MCPYIQIILPSYGVLAFVGGFAALLFTYLLFDRFQIAFTQLLKIVVVCIIGCVLGSKLMYALTQIPWLVENFSLENLVLFIPSSGYVFYGGFIGGDSAGNAQKDGFSFQHREPSRIEICLRSLYPDFESL